MSTGSLTHTLLIHVHVCVLLAEEIVVLIDPLGKK